MHDPKKKKARKTKVILIDYDPSRVEEKEILKVDECLQYKNRPSVTWVNIEGFGDAAILKEIGRCFNLHHLVIEDIANTSQRPKMEDFGDYIYVTMKMITLNEKRKILDIEHVSLILAEHFVLSFQEGLEGDVFDPIRERIQTAGHRIRKMGNDYLFYALIDMVVNGYFTILERSGEQIEMIEEELVKNPTPKTLHAIHRLKREMIFLRRSSWPVRELLGSLERGESTLMTPDTRIYFHDVYDHTIQIIETIETFREILSGMLDIYLSSINNRLTAVMKVLAIISTIFMPLTFIAGIYGMNFHYMPELEFRWGYPIVLLIMLCITLLMLLFFKKKNWF